jgi:uncharacterized surface protein with fasciclin (FAS1) repeats
MGPATKDIVETATEAGQFTTLVAALSAANLVDTLKGPGPFTVFAPTDAAFAALPAGTLDTLLRPENRDQLVSILTYHVVPGTVPSDQLLDQRRDLLTVQGQFLHVDGEEDNIVRVNMATVTQADIIAANGVIHVIDKVLLPR